LPLQAELSVNAPVDALKSIVSGDTDVRPPAVHHLHAFSHFATVLVSNMCLSPGGEGSALLEW
jgi:hypothetical protein